MCDQDFPRIEDLPRRTASDIKTKFADIMSELRKAGVVAIIHRGEIESILIDAVVYRKMTTTFTVGANDPRKQASLEELRAEFDRRLAVLQDPKAHERVDAMMDTCGKAKRRPKAGDF
jgi:hypothetical protein